MRDVTALHPDLQKKVSELRILCAKRGLKIGIGECLRTSAEQDALYAKGRTVPGIRVTNAKGSTFSSQHQWGIAFDFYRNDGMGAYNTEGHFFERVGALAKSIGLGWGGDWKSLVDKPHLYLPQWGSTTARLKQLYGTPEIFMRTWRKDQTFETNKIYAVTQGCYLRKSPGALGRKAAYTQLSRGLKKKCRNKAGYAVFRKGKRFRLMQKKRVGNQIWGKMKSGYWIPIVYKGKVRVK